MKSDAMALPLLYVLVGATALLLLLVVVDRPYRDSQGHEGATKADKLQMLVVTAQLANYGVGWWCLTTQAARKLAGRPLDADTGSYLGAGEEVVYVRASLNRVNSWRRRSGATGSSTQATHLWPVFAPFPT